MKDEPRLIFINNIQKYGENIYSEPKRFENLLKDIFGNKYQKEIKCLSASIKEGIPATLSEKKETIPYDILSSQLIQKLVINQGYEKNLAKWTVDTWAIALKVMKEVDITSPEIESNVGPSVPKKFPIFIITNPPGAKIYFDDAFRGVGPLELQIAAGTYKIECFSREYLDYSKTFDIGYKKQVQQISINLEKKPSSLTGSVFINSSPRKASIFIDSVNYGSTPRSVTINSGFHEIVIKLKGHQDAKQYVTIHSGNNPDLIFNLIPIVIPKSPLNKFGELSINTDPASEIYIDSVYKGVTPQIVKGLTAGRHQLSLRVYGRHPISKDFIIVDGKRETIFESFPKNTSVPNTNPRPSAPKGTNNSKWLVVLIIIFLAVIYFIVSVS